MSNASPVKEPSMEEILASIRRIIESGEERPSLPGLSQKMRERSVAPAPRQVLTEPSRLHPLRGDVPEPAPAEVTTRLHQPANAAAVSKAALEDLANWDFPAESVESDAAARAPSATARVEEAVRPSPALAPSAVHPSVPAPSDASMSDSGLRGAAPQADASPSPSLAGAYRPGRAPAQADEAETSPALLPAGDVGSPAPVTEEATSEPTSALSEPVNPVDEPVAFDAAPIEIPDFALEFDEEGFTAELRDEVGVLPEAEVSSVAALEMPPSVLSQVSSLMSDEAGAQVAAAFDDLARAIRDGQMKSMEEMAREMLRPMLQEWLDDNLPRLAEKLVREEIERVSRGGRR